MGLFTNFVAAIVTATTAFTGSVSTDVLPAPPDDLYTKMQSNIDDASTNAQGSLMTAGIAMIDRAKGNEMATNGGNAHRPFNLETTVRFFIAVQIARETPRVYKGNNADLIGMMQGMNGAATERLWNKYGGNDLIRDLSLAYNLQETFPGTKWSDAQSSAVDIARLMRRFADDNAIKTETKKSLFRLMRKNSLTIAGDDFSWGLPAAMGITNAEELKKNRALSWTQGWAPSGSPAMIRASAGLVGTDMRFVTVIIGQFPSSTSTEDANRITSQVATALIEGNDGLLNSDGEKPGYVTRFENQQKRKYGAFVKT